MAKAKAAAAPVVHLAQVIELPTAANDPVVNRRLRGRYPSNVIPMWKLRSMRNSRLFREAQTLAARFRPGMMVKISHRESKNFGRICRLVRTGEEGWWVVEALGGKLLTQCGEFHTSSSILAEWLEPQ